MNENIQDKKDWMQITKEYGSLFIIIVIIINSIILGIQTIPDLSEQTINVLGLSQVLSVKSEPPFHQTIS